LEDGCGGLRMSIWIRDSGKPSARLQGCLRPESNVTGELSLNSDDVCSIVLHYPSDEKRFRL